MELKVNVMKLHELEGIYKYIKQDFIKGEYAPYWILRKQIKSGKQTGYILSDGKNKLGYCICSQEVEGYILISLLAIHEEYRGREFGTEFLRKLIKGYGGNNGIVVEVEKPEGAISNEEKLVREKRIRFYQKVQFTVVSDIYYSIWNIQMDLMILPLEAKREDMEKNIHSIIYDIYLAIMGKLLIHKLKCVRLK